MPRLLALALLAATIGLASCDGKPTAQGDHVQSPTIKDAATPAAGQAGAPKYLILDPTSPQRYLLTIHLPAGTRQVTGVRLFLKGEGEIVCARSLDEPPAVTRTMPELASNGMLAAPAKVVDLYFSNPVAAGQPLEDRIDLVIAPAANQYRALGVLPLGTTDVQASPIAAATDDGNTRHFLHLMQHFADVGREENGSACGEGVYQYFGWLLTPGAEGERTLTAQHDHANAIVFEDVMPEGSTGMDLEWSGTPFQFLHLSTSDSMITGATGPQPIETKPEAPSTGKIYHCEGGVTTLGVRFEQPTSAESGAVLRLVLQSGGDPGPLKGRFSIRYSKETR